MLLLALFVAIAWRGVPPDLDAWVRPCVGLALFALLGALEPVLIVLVAAEGGAWLGEPELLGYLVGTATAAAIVAESLARWRLGDGRVPAAAGTLILLAGGIASPHALLNAAGAFVRAPVSRSSRECW